ncbi:MAG TPA: hypothetical protein VJY41_08505 [Prolixibacteraceae bacterium]|nr:hypothetical protein [Prolixibacteraceae bacterium]
MKKHLSIYVLLLISLLLMGTVVKAELPPLATPIISTLPATVSSEVQEHFIDIDGDGVVDLSFYFSGLVSNGQIGIDMYNSGKVYVEQEYPLNSPDTENVPLGISNPFYTSFLNKGTLIPTDIPSGTFESTWGVISNNLPFHSPSPLTSSSKDGLSSGYVGVYFSGASGNMYGWLNVQIHNGGSSATILSAGKGTGSGAPVVAGLGDPFAVPFPLIASILGFGLIGGGVWLRRRKK